MRIGIDLGGSKMAGVVLDGRAEIARLRVDTPRHDYAATVDTLVALVLELERRAGGPATVGVGIPGAVTSDTGLVKNANSVWLIGRPLGRDLSRRLEREVRIANDANCLAVSEAADGAGAEADVVFAAIVGTGTGAGIVVRKRLLVGPNAVAGEWGHNPLPWAEPGEQPGPLCYCGRRGCIETFLSGPGMERDYERCTGRRRLVPEIVLLAGEGDAAAEETVRRYEHRMARALAAVINVLDPDVIVLGGGLSNIGRLYTSVPALWGAYVFSCDVPAAWPAGGEASAGGAPPGGRSQREPVRTRLARAVHGDASGVRGAAWLWPE